jgi:hypothetical protein
MTVYRKIVHTPVANNKHPVIALVVGGWLDVNYPDRAKDEGLDMMHWAYHPDMKQAISVIASKNKEMLDRFLQDFALVELTNEQADIRSQGWLHKGEHEKAEHVSITVNGECCEGCKPKQKRN